jgi:hypothetical protein
MRRYEMLLPLRFNDGSAVPPDRVGGVLDALRKRFGAASFEPKAVQGEWEHEGVVYRDELARVYVDVPDTEENREWFQAFKERLKADFGQLDIWLTTHPIDVL